MNEWCRQERNSKVRLIIGGFIGFIIITLILMVTLNSLGLFDKWFIDTGKAKIDHDVYKNSSSYIDGKVSILSKQKMEFDKAENIDNKIIIINYIKEELDNFDLDKIENKRLKEFAVDVFNGKYDDLEDK